MYRITTASSATASRLSTSTTRCITRRPLLIRSSPHRRLLQTQIPHGPAAGAGASHALAGVAGGVAVLAGGYAYYKFSGASDVVATAQKTVATAKQISDAAPSPAQATHAVVKAIRAVAPSFFKVVPGLDSVVDQGFEQLDELAETHGEEVEKLVKETYAELAKLAKKGFNENTLKQATDIVTAKLNEAQALAVDIGSDATDKIFAKNPELKKSIQAGINELKDMVDVPEAQKILSETYAELKKMADKGFTPEAVLAAGVFVKGQVAKAKDLASETGEAAWDKAADLAQPYLKKMPAVQKLLDGQIDDLKKLAKDNGGPELEKIVTDMYTELKKIADKGINKDTIAQATKLVERKLAEAAKIGGQAAGKAGDVAWDKASELAKPYLKKMPEVQKLLDGKLDDLKQLAKDNGGPELEKIVTDMYTELAKLAEKGVNKDTIAKATKLVEAKLSEASKITSKAASKAGDAVWQNLFKNSDLKSLLGDRADELQRLAKENGGPELEQVLTDVYTDLKRVSEKGVNKKSLAEAKKIVEDGLARAGEITSDAASDAADSAWRKAASAAAPLLSKTPDLKRIVDDRLGDLQDVAAKHGPKGEKILEETYTKIAKIAQKGVSKESVKEMKEVLHHQYDKARALVEDVQEDL